MPEELTRPQASVLSFIQEQFDIGVAAPTCREICARFGYKSPKAATDHLAALARKGYIARAPKRARGIRLLYPSSGVPVLGIIPAGPPVDGMITEKTRIRVDPEQFGVRDHTKALALRVKGDSMEGRHIFDGDLVLLESGAIPEHECVVAALIDQESTLKTFLRRDGKVWLRAENPRYPDLIPGWDLQIQGVARAVIRMLPK
jgi:repressor LexA